MPIFEGCVDEWTDGFDATTVDSGGWSGGAEIDLDPITIDIDCGGERQTTTVGPLKGTPRRAT
ncbi:MAG: hypothetical protein D6689_22690 [Deltaproteobacteria bacterium]|nr:MAG: hypothetical protein D6689_22690 [Deltaproteobacteria bacterium]